MPRMTTKKPGKPRPGKAKLEMGENGLPPDVMNDAATATEVADAPSEIAPPESAVADARQQADEPAPVDQGPGEPSMSPIATEGKRDARPPQQKQRQDRQQQRRPQKDQRDRPPKHEAPAG